MKTPGEPGAVPAQPPIHLPTLLRQIEHKRISYRALARSAGITRGHLQRVLAGERPGSESLLRSIAEAVENAPERRGQEDIARLIDAAVHVFFLRRGRFESEIWSPPRPGHSDGKGGRP